MARRLLPLIGVSVALLAGCSSKSDQPDKVDMPMPTAEALALVFPFDSYTLTNSENHVTYRATDHLIRSCMTKQGHGWDSIDMPAVDDRWRNRLRYGVIEEDVAEKFGYHTPAELLAPAQVHEVVEQMKSREANLGRKEAEAAQQCREKANADLMHNAEVSLTKLNNLKFKTYSAAQHEPAVTKAMADWSACMDRRGYNYATPGQAADDKRWSVKDGEQASSAEIKTARADVACQRETGLISIWFRAEKQLEQEEIRKNPAYLKKVESANRRFLDNSKRALK